MQKQSSPSRALQKNIEMYDDYYQKPEWWFKFRYDTQVKKKTCLHLLYAAGFSLTGQRVLEIGFGSGAVLFSFQNSCEVYGLEISASAIDHANQMAKRRGYEKYEFQKISSDLLPYPNDFFDVVIASHVIEHVENDELMLKEIARILKADGIAVILIPINEKYQDPNHFHRYNSNEFIELANTCKLKMLVAEENEFLFHFVEKFYFEEYKRRWKFFGPLIAACFNIPASVLPFWGYRIIERWMVSRGWKARQLGCVFLKT